MTSLPAPGSTVLLYSGGLDSFIAAALLKPDVLLNVALGGKYGQVETARIGVPEGAPNLTMVQLPLEAWEDPETLILPGRNAILALIAANYGDRIWLGATAGDRTRDKDPEFARLMTAMMQHIYGDQWWLPGGRDVRVELPIKDKTKRQLVAEYLEEGLNVHTLVRATFSCYAPSFNGAECRKCKPCIRKWVALTANMVPTIVDAEEATRAALAAGAFDDRGAELVDVLDALAYADTLKR